MYNLLQTTYVQRAISTDKEYNTRILVRLYVYVRVPELDASVDR